MESKDNNSCVISIPEGIFRLIEFFRKAAGMESDEMAVIYLLIVGYEQARKGLIETFPGGNKNNIN